MAIMETHGFISEMTKVHGPNSRAGSTRDDRPNRRSPKTVRIRIAIAGILGLTAVIAAGFAAAEYPLV